MHLTLLVSHVSCYTITTPLKQKLIKGSVANTGTGLRGPWPRPLMKVAPSNRIKVLQLGHIFIEKMPQLGHILWRKCPSWGPCCRNSAWGVANFVENVCTHRKMHTRFLPHIFSWHPPSESYICLWRIYHNWSLWLKFQFTGGGGGSNSSPKFSSHIGWLSSNL